MTPEELEELIKKEAPRLWRAGRLEWKLHAGQREAYKRYRAWERASLEARKKGEKLAGRYPRVFLADCSRRWGKDYFGLIVRIEDALAKPRQHLTYATAYGKDITGIVLPIIESIIQDAPAECRPVFKRADQGSEGGLRFANGSVIKLVGIDKNPDGLRGRHSDGMTVSEAGFVDALEYSIVSIIMPQLQGRLGATIMLNSTPPTAPGTWYDEVITPDCKDNGRYVLRTIDDNPRLSKAERDEFIEAAGGRDSETCRREYYCERIRSVDRVVLPEFDPALHVEAREAPEWAHGITVIDPGVRDICAISTGWFDFERQQLYFRRCWGQRGANTMVVANALKELESATFPNSKYWDGAKIRDNPHMRYSDTEARLILDLNAIHKIKIGAADKDGAEAALHALRGALQRQQIVVHPEAVEMIQHLQNAVWNKGRTSYERNELYGHFDFVDVAKYAWRHAPRNMNPIPPKGHQFLHSKKDLEFMFMRPEDFKSERHGLTQLKKVLPVRGSWRKAVR